SAKYNGATKLCTNIYCHSNGNPGSIVYQNPAAWNAATTYSCNGCHGTTNPTTGAPDYTNGGPVPSPTANSHPKHVASFTDTKGCANCHVKTVDQATAYKFKDYTAASYHLNGSPNVIFKQIGGATGTWNGSTCANTYCHSNGTSATTPAGSVPANTTNANWGGTLGCNGCHGVGGATDGRPNYAPGTPKANAHITTITHSKQTCDVCHDSVTYSGGVYTPNVSSHNNGVYNINASLGYTPGTAAAGGTCATPGCHGSINVSINWGGTLGCVDCHNKAITRTKGRPGEVIPDIVSEFNNTWSHKRSAAGVVTNADCIVCHLEGDSTTGKASTLHWDGNIDLRDPDGATTEAAITNMSGAAFTFQRFTTTYVTGSRTTTGNTSNNIDNVITQKFCLKCHDATGATNPGARVGGAATSQYKPFNTTIAGAGYVTPLSAGVAGGVVDVDSQLATTNSTFHPVKGPQNNSYAANSRMNAPYGVTKTNGTPSAGVVINCFDCHNVSGAPLTRRTVSAHGNAVTLRGTVYDTTNSLCKICHNGYQTASGGMGHGSGSAFYSSVDSGMDTYMTNQCQKCHASTDTATRPTRGEDAHGFSYFAGNGTDKMWPRGVTETYKMYAFIRNTNQWSSTNWQPLSGPGVPAGGAQCGGNMTTSACSDTMTGYTPGGVY
ncbi:CxxxxCH/CxxCH domain c-type cytochrome, partial [Geobacter argillaceus]